jgi:pentatricopeptide repeat protein
MRAIQEEMASYEKLDRPTTFSYPSLSQFRVEASPIINPVAKEIMSDLNYEIPSDLYESFIDLVFTALNSSYTSSYHSGIVIFGFGADELFPSMIHCGFDTAPFGSVRSILFDTEHFRESGAFIFPFADREVMDIVIQGISDSVRSFVLSSMNSIGKEIADRVLRDNMTLSEEEYRVSDAINKKSVEEIVRRFSEELDGYCRRRYVNKMIEVIEHMSKEDLAVIAEALVDVTALRIRASDALESVGGPVDVCVVSKGDGLIWIKRKHYFELPQNLHYVYRRFGNVGHLFDGGNNEGK